MNKLYFLSVCLLIANIAYAQTTPTKIYIRGTGLNRNATRILKIGETTVYNTGGRGLRLTILNKSNVSVVSDKTFDTYGLISASDELATDLNSIGQDQIGILTSYDAWELHVTPNLDNAFSRLGLTVAMMTSNSYRKPYCAIFEAASNGEKTGKVVEVSYSSSANMPYAEIRGFLIEGSFVATGNQPNALLKPQGDGIGVIVNYNGNVGIGTVKPKEKLSVNGTILAKEVKVSTEASDWPDFVFEPDYKLRKLSEVENYILTNKHLPDIPSAAQMEAQGVNLAEMNKLLLQKVEELTLYSIEQKKKVEKLEEARRREQGARDLMEVDISSLKNELKLIKEMINKTN